MLKNKMTSQSLLVMSKFYPEYSGPAHRMEALYRYFNNDEIEVICGTTVYLSISRYEYNKFKVLRIPSYYGNKGKVIKHISLFILGIIAMIISVPKVYKAKTIHILGNDTVTSSILFLAILFRRKIVYEAVNEGAGSYQRFLGLIKLRFPRTSTIIAISNHIEKNLLTQGFEGEIWCRSNPVDFESFQKASDQNKIKFKNELSINKEAIILMFVGKFIPRKKQDFLLRVLELLPDNYHLILCGPQDEKGVNYERDLAYFEAIKNKILLGGLKQRVTIIKQFVRGEDFIPNSDYYLSFASPEGLGTTILEAIASEVCVIADKTVPSYRQHLENALGSYLVEANEEKVAKLILSVGSEKNDHFLKCDREKIIDKLSRDVIYEKYERLLFAGNN